MLMLELMQILRWWLKLMILNIENKMKKLDNFANKFTDQIFKQY